MSSYHSKADSLGLDFVSEMTASISHEIKNTLATINENGGLLGDLVALSERGRPLDPERLKTISANIIRRVGIADDIIRKLNNFAHSVHQPVLPVNSQDIFAVTITLIERLAMMRGVKLAIAPGEGVRFETVPFVVENLLWLCVKKALSLVTGEHTLLFDVGTVETDVLLFLQFDPPLPVERLATVVEADAQPLLFFLRCQAQGDGEKSRLCLRMPRKFIE
jgi:hypothetical protein